MKTINFQKNKGLPAYGGAKGNQGFTLLETLVAIFILVVAFTSLLSLMTTTMFSAKYANNEITATYLAQEAVDYIRNDRDTTAFQGGAWSVVIGNFLDHYGYSASDNCFSIDGCYFEVSDTSYALITQCPPGSCPNFLYQNIPSFGGYYNYTSGNSTRFKRTVNLSSGNSGDELLITVKVEWYNGSKHREQILKASLLNWQK